MRRGSVKPDSSLLNMEDEEVADSWEEAADSGVRNDTHTHGKKAACMCDLAVCHGRVGGPGTTGISKSFYNDFGVFASKDSSLFRAQSYRPRCPTTPWDRARAAVIRSTTVEDCRSHFNHLEKFYFWLQSRLSPVMAPMLNPPSAEMSLCTDDNHSNTITVE